MYGTGGVFKWADRLDVVTEDHPILDQYRSRVSGEDWALKYGASVLHLTGRL